MVMLGVWQWGRADEKARMIADYEQSLSLSEPVPFPRTVEVEAALYRRSRIDCTTVLSQGAIAGRSTGDEQGWAQTALCETGMDEVEVMLGWSREPAGPVWTGGEVTGLVVPAAQGARLQAVPPIAGLDGLAEPDPRALPNNHMAYAGQWFFFALVALVIYLLALRKRWREG